MELKDSPEVSEQMRQEQVTVSVQGPRFYHVDWTGKTTNICKKEEDKPIEPLRECSLQNKRMEGILSNF